MILGETIPGNSECGVVALVPLPYTIKTNILRLYIKSVLGLQCQVKYLLKRLLHSLL